MTVVIDNYDSFVYNLVQYIGESNPDLTVVRNDQTTIEELAKKRPDRIVISPGPGRPEEAGISVEVVSFALRNSIPILGVCLGHQAIAVAFRAEVKLASRIMHGKTSQVTHRDSQLFCGVPSTFEVMRYHSLLVQSDSIPDDLLVTATTAMGEVMALEHVTAPIFGLQFHPESIATKQGAKIISNFLRVT